MAWPPVGGLGRRDGWHLRLLNSVAECNRYNFSKPTENQVFGDATPGSSGKSKVHSKVWNVNNKKVGEVSYINIQTSQTGLLACVYVVRTIFLWKSGWGIIAVPRIEFLYSGGKPKKSLLPTSGAHVDIGWCDKLVTRMDTSKSGWTPYVYYPTLYSTPRYTIFRQIYWAQELLEKWGNQSKRQLCKGKSWVQGLVPKCSD